MTAALTTPGGHPWTLHPKGHGASIIASEMWIQFAVGIAIFALVIGLVVWIVAVRSRRPASDAIRADERAAQRWVLLGGIAMPVVVLTGLVGVSARSLAHLTSQPGPERTTIEVIGHQWWWQVRYPAYGITTANQIVVPAGQTVRLRMQSADVIHTLWVPQLQAKLDLQPQRWTSIWLRADRTGTFAGVCAEFCGLEHALMHIVVRSLPPDRFVQWALRSRAPAPLPASGAERAGEQVFLESCAYCHTVEGTPASGDVGPDLTHLASRPTIVSAMLANTRRNLAGWITDPQHRKPGAEMPATHLSAQQQAELLDYLESLR